MRKIFLLVFALISLSVFGQFPNEFGISNSKTQYYVKGGMGADSSFIFRTAYADTTAANRGFQDAIPGCIIRTTGGFLWVRNDAATAWVYIGGSAGGGTNIYNSDGTVTGNRSVYINSNDLSFYNGGVSSSKGLYFSPTNNYIGSPNATRQLLFYQDSVLFLNTDQSSSSSDSVLVRTSTGRLKTRAQSAISGSTPISSLTAATGTNDINNGDNPQKWRFATTGAEPGITITNTTSGSIGLFVSGNSGSSSKGISASGNTAIIGVTSSATGIGVWGSGSTGSSTIGVRGDAQSASGWGVYGQNSTGSAGLFATINVGGTNNNQVVLEAKNSSSSYNTTSSDLTTYVFQANATATRSSGANNLTQVAGLFTASGAQTNTGIIANGTQYAALFGTTSGNVGIGTSTPAKILHTVGTVRMASLGTASSDTTTYKPVGINSSGDVIPMTYWPVGASSGSAIPSNIFYTSDYGLISDADLSYGSSTFGTNNTDSMQYILNQASGTNPIYVIVNGKYSATQLKVKSNTHILALPGCGFIQRDNSNLQFVVNYNRSTSIIDSNIIIEGGIWNFDGWRGTAKQNQSSSNGWVTGFRFAGVRNLIVRDVILYNSRTFASFVSKAENVLYENILIKAELQNNQDGLKFLVGDNITVKNVKGISMGDDILSICSNDIFWIDTTGQSNCSGAGQIAVDSFAVYGNITNVYADKIEGDGSKHGIRLLSTTDSVKNITINNVMGTFLSQGVIIDNYTECPAAIYGNGGTNIGYFDKIVFNNLNQKITTTSVYKSCSFYLNAKVDNLTLRDIVNSYTATNDLPYFRTASNANIGNLKIEGYYQKDSINGNFMFYNNNGTITNFLLSNSTIDRYNVSDTTNTNYPFLYNQSGTITHLTLNNVSTNKVKYLVDIQGGAITTINAVNVYHRTTNTAAGAINIATSLTTDTLVMSNYNGKLPVSGSGTITTRLGDAFSTSSISGTTNYIPKFTSSSTIGNSVAYDNSGEFLINTTSDGGDFKLQIAGDVLLPPNGTAARTMSWGTGYDRTALLLYDGGAGVRHGWGLRSSEMQFFNPTGAHFSWNKGGDFQTSGTNELMRLDCTTGNLSIGTISASAKLHVISTTEQFRAGYDASNYYSTTVGSTGGVTFDAVGSGSRFTYSDGITLPAGAATATVGSPLKFTTGTSLTTAEAGAMEYSTPQLFFTNGAAVRQELFQGNQNFVQTQFDKTSNTTLGNVTNLSVNVAAGKAYRFEAILYTSSNVAGGVKAAISGTATATTIIYEGLTTDAGTTTQSRATSLGTAVGAVTAVTAAYIKITGTIIVNAAGTLTVQFAQNASNGSASSVLVGSTFHVIELAYFP